MQEHRPKGLRAVLGAGPVFVVDTHGRRDGLVISARVPTALVENGKGNCHGQIQNEGGYRSTDRQQEESPRNARYSRGHSVICPALALLEIPGCLASDYCGFPRASPARARSM